MERPTKDQVFEHIAFAAAGSSLCVRAKVGATIVDADGRIIATGYNGPPAGFDHGDLSCDQWCPRAGRDTGTKVSDYSDCPSLHAEANALMASERTQRKGGTLYVTTDVCYGCAKLVANSGITRVVVADDGGDTMHRNPSRSYEFLRDCGIEVILRES